MKNTISFLVVNNSVYNSDFLGSIYFSRAQRIRTSKRVKSEKWNFSPFCHSIILSTFGLSNNNDNKNNDDGKPHFGKPKLSEENRFFDSYRCECILREYLFKLYTQSPKSVAHLACRIDLLLYGFIVASFFSFFRYVLFVRCRIVVCECCRFSLWNVSPVVGFVDISIYSICLLVLRRILSLKYTHSVQIYNGRKWIYT